MYLGYKTFQEKPSAESKGDLSSKGLFSDYLTTVGLTLTNPMTIASFIAIFAGIGMASGNYSSATLLVFGVFLGSAGWWIILSNGVGLLRKKAHSELLEWVNKISGLIMAGFALMLLINLIIK